ncbi:MAG: hypothetical protein AAF366_15165 [Pseudomonadota bacterium]
MAQTNDIEDVLSSIRRLVSSDPESSSSPGGRDRSSVAAALLLEPANRVTEPEDPFQTIQALDGSEAEAPVAEEVADEDGSSEAKSASLDSTDIWLGSADEMVGLAQEERDGRDAAHVLAELDTDTAAITTDLTEDQGDPLVWPAPAPAPPAPESYLEDTDYVAEAGAGTEEVDEPPIASEPATEIETGAMHARDEERGGDVPVAEDVADAPAPAAEAGSDGADIDLADLGETSDKDVISLDDEGFRDLIADIVRQELAGELGERITRNVRKLVRREIRQLLSSDEFD